MNQKYKKKSREKNLEISNDENLQASAKMSYILCSEFNLLELVAEF